MLVLISRPPGENLEHYADEHTRLALLALNAHHLHEEKVCRRSVKRVLGLGNVFLMFIAIAYVALECKTLLMSSVISNPVCPKAVGVL